MRTATDILAEFNIGLRSIRHGNQKTRCPHCRDREPSLSVKITAEAVLWNCHRAKCGWKGAKFYDDQS